MERFLISRPLNTELQSCVLHIFLNYIYACNYITALQVIEKICYVVAMQALKMPNQRFSRLGLLLLTVKMESSHKEIKYLTALVD